jgi:hypothetical protein
VTETDELAVALEDASRWWPTLSRGQLVTRLALEGHCATEQARDERRQQRLAAIKRHSGVLAGVYQPGYLEELREDWPE